AVSVRQRMSIRAPWQGAIGPYAVQPTRVANDEARGHRCDWPVESAVAPAHPSGNGTGRAVELSGLYEAHDYCGASPRIWAGECWRDAKGVSASHVRVDAPDNRGGRRATRNQLCAGVGRGDTPCARVSTCDQISSIPDLPLGQKSV